MSGSTVAREAGTSQQARRRSRRRPSLSHLLIALAAVAAFILNFLALQDRDETAMVAVADRALVAGSALAAGDVRFVPIEAGFEGLGSLFEESSLGSYEGWILERSVEEGELVELAALLEPGAPSGLRSMSIPVPVEHAAGGTLVAGDRIDVVSVAEGVAGYVVTGIEVLGVSEQDPSAFAAAGQYHIVVAVDSAQALALSAAMDSGSLEIVRSTGAETPSQPGSRDEP